MTTATETVRGMDEVREILEGRNIEWEFGDILISSIDLGRSLMWNSREDGTGLNQYWVDTYTISYRNKEELPPIIVMKASPTSKRFLVLSGHHRVAAATKAGLKTLPGFTVDVLTDALRLYVTTEANRKVGYGLSEQQRVESALRFVRQGESAAAAARTVGIDEGKVTRHLAQMRADDRIQKTTAKWQNISSGQRLRLNAIQSDDLLKKACDLTLAAKLGGAEVNNLVRDINKGRTDAAKEDVLATMWEVYRTRIESGGKHKVKTTAQAGWMGLVRASISRIANPGAYDKMDEIILSRRAGFGSDLVAARDFLIEAVKRAEAREKAVAATKAK